MQASKLLVLLLIVLISGCSESGKPKNLVPEDKYIDIVTEFQLIRAMDRTRVDSLQRDSLKKVVLQKYDVSQSQFDVSHRYYQQEPKAQAKRIQKALDQLRMEMSRLNNPKADSTHSDTTHKAQPTD